jgi:hypothetical protein
MRNALLVYPHVSVHPMSSHPCHSRASNSGPSVPCARRIRHRKTRHRGRSNLCQFHILPRESPPRNRVILGPGALPVPRDNHGGVPPAQVVRITPENSAIGWWWETTVGRILPALRLQISVEPAGELADIPEHGEPAVLFAVPDHQPDRAAGLADAGHKPLGLLQRHQGIGITVEDQQGWNVRCDITDG